MKKCDINLHELCNTLKRNNLWIIAVPDEKERLKGEHLFKEITNENFPNLGKDLDT